MNEIVGTINNNKIVGDINYQYGSSGSGTSDYNDLANKPSINGVKLIGNKTTEELGIEASKEVHIGAEEPTGEEVVWIDTTEEADKIPTKTSELENDSGFLTEIPEEYAKKTDIPDVSNLAKKSDIPSIDGLATEEYVNTAIQNALEVVENGTY